MYKILTKLTPIFVAFLMFVSLPVQAEGYAHNDGTSEAELYDASYDMCLIKAAQEEGFTGVLQTQLDFNEFCGCAANTIVDIYNEDISESELDATIERRALQCMQPHIKPFITNICHDAASDNDIANATQTCDCFGNQVEAHAANDISRFFDDAEIYLEASANFCGLGD